MELLFWVIYILLVIWYWVTPCNHSMGLHRYCWMWVWSSLLGKIGFVSDLMLCLLTLFTFIYVITFMGYGNLDHHETVIPRIQTFFCQNYLEGGSAKTLALLFLLARYFVCLSVFFCLSFLLLWASSESNQWVSFHVTPPFAGFFGLKRGGGGARGKFFFACGGLNVFPIDPLIFFKYFFRESKNKGSRGRGGHVEWCPLILVSIFSSIFILITLGFPFLFFYISYALTFQTLVKHLLFLFSYFFAVISYFYIQMRCGK